MPIVTTTTPPAAALLADVPNDHRTPLGLLLPHPDNSARLRDVQRLRAALILIDALLASRVELVNGLIPENLLPAIAITDTFEVASEAAMLALTAQRGDVAVRSDLNKSFILRTAPASTLANWTELRTPTDAVLSVAGLTGAITGVALKTALGLAIADVSGLSTALATLSESQVALAIAYSGVR